MNLDDLIRHCGEWLRGVGPESDIVMSSRVRLARNLAEFPFVSRASESDRVEIETQIQEALGKSRADGDLLYCDVETLDSLDRQFLVERHLISREHADAEGSRFVAIHPDESFSVMVNEEDHLRVQVMQSGLNLHSAWEKINALDDRIEKHVVYAYDEKLGYLTACPTNVGTGMRVSVMLHLPALVITRQIDKVFRSLQKISLAVRGLYGEGSQALGDFYQISNQITLGRTEDDILNQVADIVPAIINYERRARDFLSSEKGENLGDQVSRAYGILRSAKTISSEETMHLLSSVRMGVSLGLIKELEIPAINDMFIQTQPAHLQKRSGTPLASADRNIERARYLRRQLEQARDDSSDTN